MRHIIAATHSTMAKGIAATVQFILGEQEHLSFLCAYTDTCMDVKKALSDLLEQFADSDEIIILTDLLGGSVNNEAMQFLNRERVYVIAGMNLALLIQLLSADESEPVDQLIAEAIDAAREGIVFCNPLIQKEDSAEMDEF